MLRAPGSRLDAVFGGPELERLVHLIELNVGHRAGALVDQGLALFLSADLDAISSAGESVETVPIIEQITINVSSFREMV